MDGHYRAWACIFCVQYQSSRRNKIHLDGGKMKGTEPSKTIFNDFRNNNFREGKRILTKVYKELLRLFNASEFQIKYFSMEKIKNGWVFAQVWFCTWIVDVWETTLGTTKLKEDLTSSRHSFFNRSRYLTDFFFTRIIRGSFDKEPGYHSSTVFLSSVAILNRQQLSCMFCFLVYGG